MAKNDPLIMKKRRNFDVLDLFFGGRKASPVALKVSQSGLKIKK
jgi:hypothetical protein